MKTQIPLFRALKLGTKDEYVKGFLNEVWTRKGLEQQYEIDSATVYTNDEVSIFVYTIDLSTLSISLLDMIDSEGTRIFASLSEDGKGGDIVNIFGKGLCYLTFDIDGIQAHIIDNTANIFDDIFPFSKALMEKDVGIIKGIQQ